ncbi:hypothetical protein THIOKS12990003 [Thiocapsa sp. KS1]|nr:hypothetical protein THIOKS12990003 [Thiocapsa sp. KS1]
MPRRTVRMPVERALRERRGARARRPFKRQASPRGRAEGVSNAWRKSAESGCGRFAKLTDQQAADQVSGENNEDIDADAGALGMGHVRMRENNEQDGDGSQSLQVGAGIRLIRGRGHERTLRASRPHGTPMRDRFWGTGWNPVSPSASPRPMNRLGQG